jgi:plastocyanin
MRQRAVATIAVLLMAGGALGPVPAVFAGGGCHAAGIQDARGVSVDLSSLCFAPMVIRVDPGRQVTWTNRDPTPHTVTGPLDAWGSPEPLATGQSATYRFATAGIYPYACILHPGMVGAVVVGDGGSPGAAASASMESVPPSPQQASPLAAQAPASPVRRKGLTRAWILGAAGIGIVGLGLGYGVGRARRRPQGEAGTQG